jgi:hypothetical protein
LGLGTEINFLQVFVYCNECECTQDLADVNGLVEIKEQLIKTRQQLQDTLIDEVRDALFFIPSLLLNQ